MEQCRNPGESHLRPAKAENPTTVQLTTVDDFVAEARLDRLDFIKIDAEGSDFEVLKGARRTVERFRPTILLEIHLLSRFGGSGAAVLHFLDVYDYAVSEIKGKYSLDWLCKPSP